MIYLDANATTPLDPEVLNAMMPCLSEFHGNPSSGHAAGRKTRAAIDNARDEIAALLKCKPSEIVFTSGGTESNNIAILGLARTLPGKHIVTCATEHHAVLHPLEYLEQHEDYTITRLPVSADGTLDPATLEAALTPNTAFVSLMTANNETGVQHPFQTISKICKSRGILFHSDAIQSFGKEHVTTEHFDLLSLAAHKFYGPKGSGILFIRGGLPLRSIQFGGSQEGQRRAGTENPAAIVGLAKAASLAVSRLQEDSNHTAKLRNLFETNLLQALPELHINGASAPRIPNTTSITFPSSDAESLLMGLDMEGICASSGSACMVGSLQPSHVLLAMGHPPHRAASTLRFSFSRTNTEAEIHQTIQKIALVWKRLKN